MNVILWIWSNGTFAVVVPPPCDRSTEPAFAPPHESVPSIPDACVIVIVWIAPPLASTKATLGVSTVVRLMLML